MSAGRTLRERSEQGGQGAGQGCCPLGDFGSPNRAAKAKAQGAEAPEMAAQSGTSRPAGAQMTPH